MEPEKKILVVQSRYTEKFLQNRESLKKILEDPKSLIFGPISVQGKLSTENDKISSQRFASPTHWITFIGKEILFIQSETLLFDTQFGPLSGFYCELKICPEFLLFFHSQREVINCSRTTEPWDCQSRIW